MEETGCDVICGAPTTPAVKRINEGESDLDAWALPWFVSVE